MDEESRVDQESGSVLEDPVTPQLAEMLVLAPYQAPEKKGKEPKGGPCRRGPSDDVSGETEVVSSHEEDGDKEEEEEEVESDSPRITRRKKRTASENPEEATPKRKKVTLSVSSDSESEHSPRRAPRVKPLAES